MSRIKEKIAALLALATSPNENEAKAALLKARELMVKNKLTPEEIGEQKSEKVVREKVNVTCTAMTDSWAVSLASIIAGRHCCKAFRWKQYKAKTVYIGFVGFEDDFAVCKRIFLYAYECVEIRCRQIRERNRRAGCTATEIREMCNAYGAGFCSGLQAAYDEQDEEHQEWGLVLKVPQAVEDSMKDMNKPQAFGKIRADGWRRKFVAAGYAEGKAFDPNHCLDSGAKNKPELM